jgi:hypothetical protein
MAELLQTLKQFLPIIIITIVLGYFLGLSVSTVVDYRLKDAVLNLPQPKNNIVIRLDDKDIAKETFIGSKQTRPKEKSKQKPIAKSKSKVEQFTNYKKDISNTRCSDNNVDSYALAYDISKRASEKSNSEYPYVPFNYEDENLNYSSIVDISKTTMKSSWEDLRPATSPNSINSYRTDKSKDRIAELPERKSRDRNYLKQRPWMDTTYSPIDN